MKRSMLSVPFLLLSLSAALSAVEKEKGEMKTDSVAKTKLTREYLVANGFKASARDPEVFVLEGARLGDVAKKLGFAISSLRPIPSSPPDQDIRHVFMEGAHCIVESEPAREMHNFGDRPVLDKPEMRCNVMVSFRKPPPPHQRTDGTPQMKIKSVTVPKDRTKPIEATIELSTNGKTPLAVDDWMLTMCLYENNERVFDGDAPISARKRRITTVQPGKPAVMVVNGLTNTIDGKPWSDLAPGKYILRVSLGNADKSYDPAYDYQWVPKRIPGEVFSDDNSITIGPSDEKK